MIVRRVLAMCLVPLAIVSGYSSGLPAPSATTTGRTAATGSRVAVVVDTSQATANSMNFLRSAVATLITRLPEGTEVLLATTGRRLQVRVAPTVDRRKAADSANAMTSDGGPTVLLDGLLEIDERFMRNVNGRNGVFVLVTGDGSESSKSEGTAFNSWLATLSARSIVAHAVVLKTGNGVPEVVAKAIAGATGGRCETIGSAALLQDKMEAIAAMVAQLR